MEVETINQLLSEANELYRNISEREKELEAILKKNSYYLMYCDILRKHKEFNDYLRESNLIISDQNTVTLKESLSTYEELDNIINEVCVCYNITLSELRKKNAKGKLSRFKEVREPRQVIYFVSTYVKYARNKSFGEIAEYYFNQNHATMMHSVKRIKNLLECKSEKDLRLKVREICKRLNYTEWLNKTINLESK